jgi:hypothetical protein
MKDHVDKSMTSFTMRMQGKQQMNQVIIDATRSAHGKEKCARQREVLTATRLKMSFLLKGRNLFSIFFLFCEEKKVSKKQLQGTEGRLYLGENVLSNIGDFLLYNLPSRL